MPTNQPAPTYVPAAAGAYVVDVYVSSDGAPTEADVWVEHPAIVAWKIFPGNDHYGTDSATPITCEARSENLMVRALPERDGSLRETASGCYADIGQAKAEALRRARAEWDRDQLRVRAA